MKQKYYTISQFARTIGVSNQTIYRWIESGKVKTVEVLGKRMIPSNALEETYDSERELKVPNEPLDLLEEVMYGNEHDGTKDQAYEELKRYLKNKTS